MIDILKVADGSEDTEALVTELQSMANSKGNVYQTFLSLPEDGGPCVFLTTSKDIHLALGRLSHQGHRNLACVILRACDIEEVETGLLSVPNDKGSLLATISCNGDTTIIHLSAAR